MELNLAAAFDFTAFGCALNFTFKARFRRVAVEIYLIFFDDADVVGALLLVVLLEVGHRALTLHLDGGPRASVVVDDDELLLLPGGIRVDEVPVHHTVTVGVAFLEHHQTRRPVLECSLGIGIGKGFGDLNLRDAIDVVVGTTVGDGLRVERVVVVVGMDIPEDELIARTE